jgi:hypothetical protein
MNELLWENCLNTQRSIQLEHSLTTEQKTHAIFKEYVSFIRKTLTSEQMLTVQRFFAPTIVEAGAILSDNELADIIAQAAQELSSEIPDAKYLTDPDKIDVAALEKGDVEHGIQTESFRQSKQLLSEIGIMTMLAGPSIGKLLAEIIEWCKRKFGTSSSNEGEQQALIFLDLIYKQAKKTDKIPSISELQALAKEPGFFGLKSSIADAYKLSEDPEKSMLKDIRRAFQKIVQAVDEEHTDQQNGHESHGTEFDPKGKEAQPVDKHMLHILFELTYSSKGAKAIANISHTAHEYILKVVQVVLTPILALYYGFLKKDGWKKAWSKADKIANGVYIACMLLVLGYEALHHFAGMPSVMDMIDKLFGSSEKMLDAATNVTKAGDLTVAGIEEFLAASTVAGD